MFAGVELVLFEDDLQNIDQKPGNDHRGNGQGRCHQRTKDSLEAHHQQKRHREHTAAQPAEGDVLDVIDEETDGQTGHEWHCDENGRTKRGTLRRDKVVAQNHEQSRDAARPKHPHFRPLDSLG